MFINQLSVFIENREGRLEQVLDILKEEKINIISLSLADSSDFGLLRMIVSDSEKGKNALKAKGFSAMLTPTLEPPQQAFTIQGNGIFFRSSPFFKRMPKGVGILWQVKMSLVSPLFIQIAELT